MLKYILLGFLNYRSLTGYELKSLMDESTMHFWHAYHSQIYTTLRKLEDEGLVISETEDGGDRLNRRRYTLTDAGRAHLRAWLDQPLDEIVPVKEDLLLRVFFSGDREPGAVIDELRFQRQLHQRKLDEYLRMSASETWDAFAGEAMDAQRHGIYWGATLRFGIDYEKLYLGWLDATITEIEALDWK